MRAKRARPKKLKNGVLRAAGAIFFWDMGSILMILGLLIIYNMGGVNNSENPDLLIIYNMGG